MSENAVVRARINQQIKDEATEVLESIGLNPSSAFRLMMTRIAREKKLPFDPLVPNATTQAAINQARQGNVASFDTVADLMADLNADD